MQKNNINRIRLLNAVAQIRKCYPRISSENIRFAAMVFYPVARVDVIAMEESVEAFDPVQFTVLKFLDLGLDRIQISTITGLTPEYVGKVMELLVGYGHIEPDGSITTIGRKSIDEERKIELKESRRHIQLDAISLSVIPYEISVDENVFCRKTDARRFHVGAIAYPEGIDKDSLEIQLQKMDFSSIAGDVHVNIVSISKMECLELRYSIACMLVLAGSDIPVVFGRRTRAQQKGGGISWRPFGITDNKIREQYGFETNIKDVGQGIDYLLSMKKRFESERELYFTEMARGKRPKKSDFNGEMEEWRQASRKWDAPLSEKERKTAIWKAVTDFYPFKENYCHWKNNTLFLEASAFEKLQRTSAISRVLFGFATEGLFLLTTETLCGHIVMIRPMEGNTILEDVLLLLKQAIEKYGGFNVDKYLQDHFTETTDTFSTDVNALEILKRVLSKYMNKKTSEDDVEEDG